MTDTAAGLTYEHPEKPQAGQMKQRPSERMSPPHSGHSSSGPSASSIGCPPAQIAGGNIPPGEVGESAASEPPPSGTNTAPTLRVWGIDLRESSAPKPLLLTSKVAARLIIISLAVMGIILLWAYLANATSYLAFIQAFAAVALVEATLVLALATSFSVRATEASAKAAEALAHFTETLVRSGNKRDSIAAAERRLGAWEKIAKGVSHPEFLDQGSIIWGDALYHEYMELVEHRAGHKSLKEGEFDAKYPRLVDKARQRVIDWSKAIEHMKSRPASEFAEVEEWKQPEGYEKQYLAKPMR